RWQSDRALASQLDAAVKVEGYSVRPPKGYRMQRGNGPEGVKAFAWVGAPRADRTWPSLMLNLILPPPGEAGKHTIEELADQLLAGVKRRRANWQQSKTEKGLVNAVPFARIRWTGTEPTLQRQMQGFIYVALDGSTVVQMASQD